VTQIITEDTVWSRGSHIELTEKVQVAHGVKLRIEPGVHVEGNGYEIQAFGTLKIGSMNSKRATTLEDVNIHFGSNYSTPGKIIADNAVFDGGSFLDDGNYGSFSVENSVFDNVFGFYIWYPVSESDFTNNFFNNSDGLSIGVSRVQMVVEGNTFYNVKDSYYGATISSWATYGGEDFLKVTNNAFYDLNSYAMELREGYDTTGIYADGNFIYASQEKGKNDFILDANDSLERAGIIDLRNEASTPPSQTPDLVFRGDKSRNEIFGGDAEDKISGKGGNDTLHGLLGKDRLEGGAGRDSLFGGEGNDKLFGGNGADKLFGEHGRDKLFGGSGHDILDGGRKNDVMTGDEGSDTFMFDISYRGHDRITDFEEEDTVVFYRNGANMLRDAESFVEKFATDTSEGVLFEFGSRKSLLVEGVFTAEALIDNISFDYM
jgi:Ca2+-binding RTX toxin-like protein